MRHRLLIVLFVFTSFTALAGTPTLIVDDADGRAALALSQVDVHVLVRGHLARTTYDLTWRNDLDRTVGGTFVFPLPKGAEVSDVALWFGDHLRHAVAVERVRAKAAYAETVHRRVDPALAEWTSGRAFRLHLFPIPAHGTKSVHIAYDEDLTTAPYMLDLRYGADVAEYDVSIDADAAARVEAEGTVLTQRRGVWRAHGEQSRLNAVVRIMRSLDERALVARAADGMWYASAPLRMQTEGRLVAPAAHVLVLWDASGSASHRDTARVVDFLEDFVQRQLPDADVTVVPFHIDVEPPQRVDRAALRHTLCSIATAGATNLIGLLESLPRIATPDSRIVLVTDGVSSLGDSGRLSRAVAALAQLHQPIAVVNATPSPDDHVLNAIARSSGGWYVDLNDAASDAAVETTMHSPAARSIESGWPAIRDVAVSTSNVVNARSWQAIVALPIVAGGRRRELPVSLVDDADLVRRAWARARLHEMLVAGASDAEVLEHGRAFNEITPRTSLLVLENWSDYERYGIPMPPDVREQKKASEAAAARFRQPQWKPGSVSVHIERVSQPIPADARWFITGTVSATDGSVIPGVTVTYQPSDAPPVVRITDAQGRYTIGSPSIPSSFTIRAELAGYGQVSRVFPRGAVSGSIIDMKINPTVSEAITVTAEAPLIDVRSVEETVDVVSDRETLRRLIDGMNGWNATPDRFAAYVSARATAVPDKWFYAKAAESMFALDRGLGVRVASDLAEAWPDDAALLRVVGRLLDGWGRRDLARLLYERALEIAPREPQTWRELILLDRAQGRFDDATRRLTQLQTADLDSRHAQTLDELREEIADPKLARLRVETMWDSDFSDVDLHVVEPNGEEVSYEHLHSRNGGSLHADIRGGFGPEVYTSPGGGGVYRVALVFYSGDRTEANESTLVHVATYESGRRSDHLIVLEHDRERVEVATIW